MVGVCLKCTVLTYSIGATMPAIEYTLLNQISVTHFAQDVEVMGRSGSRIRVPCLGFTNKSIAKTTNGHYVKVIAERYSDGNAHAHCDWKYISVDEAVLGWRTNDAKRNWVVYLLVDDKGMPIIVPRSTKKPPALLAAG